MTEFSLRAEAASHIRLLRTKLVSHLPREPGYLLSRSPTSPACTVSRPYPSIYPSSHPFIHPSVRPPVRPAIRVLVGAVKSHEHNYQPRKQATLAGDRGSRLLPLINIVAGTFYVYSQIDSVALYLPLTCTFLSPLISFGAIFAIEDRSFSPLF